VLRVHLYAGASPDRRVDTIWAATASGAGWKESERDVRNSASLRPLGGDRSLAGGGNREPVWAPGVRTAPWRPSSRRPLPAVNAAERYVAECYPGGLRWRAQRIACRGWPQISSTALPLTVRVRAARPNSSWMIGPGWACAVDPAERCARRVEAALIGELAVVGPNGGGEAHLRRADPGTVIAPQ
jgi:hypothetical protein